MLAQRPRPGNYADYQQVYIDQIPNGTNILSYLNSQLEQEENWILSLDKKLLAHRYEEGKWSVAEVLQHLIDTERVLSYRVLCLARGEQQGLPGFDQDDYASNADVSGRDAGSLLDEMRAVRNSTLFLLNSLKDNEWDNTGIASDYHVSVRGIIFVIAGHYLHHKRIIEDRYMTKTKLS